MPGHNHSAICLCGWCYKPGGGGYKRAASPKTSAVRPFSRFESSTIPNAHCPVCGETVFFYQSPYGGRVFFDELGPPWPKHPCTDNGAEVRLAASTPASPTRVKATWETAGWMTVIVKKSSMVGSWHLVPIEILERHSHIIVLSAEPIRVPDNCCAAFNGFDRKGHALLSIVDLDQASFPKLVKVYDSDKFSGVSAFDAQKARR